MESERWSPFALLMRGASSSAIIANKNGERFHAEDCHYDMAGKIGTE